MHPRQVIRQAFSDRLADVVPDTDPPAHRTACLGRVWPSRTKPLFPKDMPALLVYSRAEKVRDGGDADGHGPLTRQLNLTVEILAEGGDDGLNATLDAITVQVEDALDGFDIPSTPLAGWEWMVTQIRLDEVDTDFSSEAEKVIGATRLTYVVTYQTARVVTESGDPPTRVFVGYAPEIGAAHEPEYEEVIRRPI
ncbi:MAG: hypothetical protein HQL41_09025 [Alphaproteobacteria bacterium]|nr:hypothetical protein [Alphaproteobacteria bacterium]